MKREIEVEEWKTMNDFPYAISNQGKVVILECRNNRFAVGRLIKFRPTKTAGYYGAVLTDNSGKKRMVHLHNYVAKYFLGPRPLGPAGKPMTINHEDGDKSNNRASNLKYMTLSENMKHAWKNNLIGHGYIISDEVVRTIRILGRAGVRNCVIAKLLGVKQKYVCNILRGHRRKESVSG